MNAFLSRISLLLSTLACVMSLLPVALNLQVRTYEPLYPKRIRLNAVLIGDAHTDGDIIRDRNNVLRRSFGAVAGSASTIDALVIAGDITNSGAEIEYRNLNRMLKYLDKSKQLIPQLGNHDSGGTSDDKVFENECLLFQQFCEDHGIEAEENYYLKTVNGYYFIVMGSEKMFQNEAYISDTQLEWLDETLTCAEKNGKIAFVICHQPLNGTHGVGDVCFGEQSSQVKQVIENHTDSGMTVLFVSGHIHAPFTASSFETVSEGLYSLNLPSFQYTNGGGQGVIVEVYDDKVLLRARDFLANIDETCYEIPLADAAQRNNAENEAIK